MVNQKKKQITATGRIKRVYLTKVNNFLLLFCSIWFCKLTNSLVLSGLISTIKSNKLNWFIFISVIIVLQKWWWDDLGCVKLAICSCPKLSSLITWALIYVLAKSPNYYNIMHILFTINNYFHFTIYWIGEKIIQHLWSSIYRVTAADLRL